MRSAQQDIVGEIPRRLRLVIPVLVALLGVGAFWTGQATADRPNVVNLLESIDPIKDAVSGDWKVTNGILICASQINDARIRLPYQPPEEYDFHIVFCRTQGNKDITQILAKGQRQFRWVMGGDDNTVCGFDQVNGNWVGNSGTAVRSKSVMESGVWYDSVVQVRNDGVTAFVNGAKIVAFKTDYSNVSLEAHQSIGDNTVLGLYTSFSTAAFKTIEVTEITGQGKLISHQGRNVGQPQSGNQVDEKKEDQPAPQAPLIHADAVQDNTPISGPATRPCRPIATIKCLWILEKGDGMMLGQASDVVLTLTRGDRAKLTSIRFVTPIGDEMCLARDEVQRYIHVTYPNWFADSAEVSFEDKYIPHDGGSIGTALGTLILSAIEGFDITSDAAITGDISANGKVRAIGGLSAKIRGATAAKCTVVAVPTENYDQLVDTVVYGGPATITNIQVVGITTLDDAVAVMRTDRDLKLVQALAIFEGIKQNIQKSPAYLHSKEAQGLLAQVVDLAPQHLSAKLLLLIAQDKLPKTLSATASEYYTMLAVQGVLPILQERAELGTTDVPSAVVKDGLARLRKLRPMADQSVRPLIDAWSGLIYEWNMFQAGDTSRKALIARAEVVDDAIAKLQADQELMQKMLKEGM